MSAEPLPFGPGWPSEAEADPRNRLSEVRQEDPELLDHLYESGYQDGRCGGDYAPPTDGSTARPRAYSQGYARGSLARARDARQAREAAAAPLPLP